MRLLTRDVLSLYLYDQLIFPVSLSALCPLKKRLCLKNLRDIIVYSSVPGTVDKASIEENFGLVLFLSALTGWEGQSYSMLLCESC